MADNNKTLPETDVELEYVYIEYPNSELVKAKLKTVEWNKESTPSQKAVVSGNTIVKKVKIFDGNEWKDYTFEVNIIENFSYEKIVDENDNILQKTTIDGNVEVTEDLQVKQNLNVEGDLNVAGAMTVVEKGNLTVKDNIIITNSDGAVYPLTGIVTTTGEVDENGNKIAYAAPLLKTDSINQELQIGKGYLTEENGKLDFKFKDGEEQALATRSSDIKNNYYTKWDEENHTLINAELRDENGIPTADNISIGNHLTLGDSTITDYMGDGKFALPDEGGILLTKQEAEARYVNIDGDTMTGQFKVNVNTGEQIQLERNNPQVNGKAYLGFVSDGYDFYPQFRSTTFQGVGMIIKQDGLYEITGINTSTAARVYSANNPPPIDDLVEESVNNVIGDQLDNKADKYSVRSTLSNLQIGDDLRGKTLYFPYESIVDTSDFENLTSGIPGVDYYAYVISFANGMILGCCDGYGDSYGIHNGLPSNGYMDEPTFYMGGSDGPFTQDLIQSYTFPDEDGWVVTRLPDIYQKVMQETYVGTRGDILVDCEYNYNMIKSMQPLIFKNITINPSDWQQYTSSDDLCPYKAVLSSSKVTSDMVPEVYPGYTLLLTTPNYPEAEDGAIVLYIAKIPERPITIPLIICRPINN